MNNYFWMTISKIVVTCKLRPTEGKHCIQIAKDPNKFEELIYIPRKIQMKIKSESYCKYVPQHDSFGIEVDFQKSDGNMV